MWVSSRSLSFDKFGHCKYLKSVIFGVIVWLFGVEVNFAFGDRTFTKVYEPILGTSACFKRLNGTHEIGCRSSSGGDVGVLHLIEDEQSLNWVLKDGPHAPYIAVLYPVNFTRQNLLQFRNSGRVKGVLLLTEDVRPEEPHTKSVSNFSTDSTCPNQEFNFYSNETGKPKSCAVWNENGNSLLYENFNFPIFYIKNATHAEKVVNCYETFNKPINKTEPRSWPLCAGELKSFMMAAVDTPTCLRRSSVFSINPSSSIVCDPLGDQNLWGTLYPQNNTSNESQSAVIVAARFDGASLFDELTPSADTSITGLVTLLAVIKHLSSIRDQLVLSSTSPNIYFMLFNGESFGYIGSSRIVYDMLHDNFPVKIDEIKYYLEMNQAALKGSDSYFIHQTDLSQSKELTDKLTSEGEKKNLKITTLQKSDRGIPPSSLHSFLRERPDLTGVVITNHREDYRNQYYNSIFDTKTKMEYEYGDRSVFSLQQKLASLSAAVANTLVSLVHNSEDPAPKVSADLELIDELLHCYLETSNCSIFRNISGINPAEGSPTEPYPLYVGVARHTNSLTLLTKYLLVTYLGTQVENVTNEEDCWSSDVPGPHYFINNICWACPILNSTDAKSPAFFIPDYDWSSGKYSTWSESVWQKFSVRVFLKPSLFHEVMTLISGIIIAVISMVIVRYVNAKADILFPSRAEAMVC